MNFLRLCASVFFLLCAFSEMSAENECCSRIPEEDKQRIEKFLSYLIFDEGFAYALFGSKPISTIGYDKKTPSSYRELYPHPIFELVSWWHTWEKYSHFFLMRDYIFFAQDSEEWFEIFLINKSSCQKIIEDNLSLFRNKIGKNISASELLEHIFSSSHLFVDGLNKSHALLGLLLGYGKENSISFEKYFSPNRKTNLSPPKNSAEISVVEIEELMLPCFSSFSDEETEKLVEKYRNERNVILNLYSDCNFLEITLNKLMSRLPDYVTCETSAGV